VQTAPGKFFVHAIRVVTGEIEYDAPASMLRRSIFILSLLQHERAAFTLQTTEEYLPVRFDGFSFKLETKVVLIKRDRPIDVLNEEQRIQALNDSETLSQLACDFLSSSA